MAKKQLQIAGTEKESIKEIDAAAEAYADARDERMELSERESEAKDALLAVMKRHKVEVYRDDNVTPPLVVTLIPGTDDVKVKRAKPQEDEVDAA